MKIVSIALAVAGLASVAACTPRAASVAPVSMGNAFEHVSCRDASIMLNNERQTVATLTSAQNSAATADAVGVFLFAVPVGNLTGGNKAGELGAAKGKVLALENRMMSCR